jgi:ribose transport system substrate-binding protein
VRQITTDMVRRDFFKLAGAGGVAFGAAGALAACGEQRSGDKAGKVVNPNDEYVFLSFVTQVPFWEDHKRALKDFSAVAGAKTSFIGPPDADVAEQARQLDELITRKPAGILLFIGDADAITPGIGRATKAGIPVILIISDAPKSDRVCHIGIDGIQAGRVGGEMLARAVGGRGKVILGTFASPNVLDRVEGYKRRFRERYPGIEVVQVVNDKADPSFAPDAYASAISAHPDVAGIGGTDGDSGLGAAKAVKEAGKTGQIKIVAMDRNDDMLTEVEAGTIVGSVVQKSYDEAWLGCWMLYWLNHSQLKPVPDYRKAGINPLPEQIVTGTWQLTRDNVAQFKHKKGG